MSALALTPLAWPPTGPASGDRRWACHVLAVLAREHHAVVSAHQQLTSLLDALDRPGIDAGELAERLTAIHKTLIRNHDPAHVFGLLHRHAHHDTYAHIRRASHHSGDAITNLRDHADRARRRRTPTGLRDQLTRILADLDAAGAAITAADRTLIHQLKEVIHYPEQPEPPAHPEPTRGTSVSDTGELRRAASTRGGSARRHAPWLEPPPISPRLSVRHEVAHHE